MDDLTVKKALAGDRVAFKTIYNEYKDFVWNLAIKYTGSENIAEDAVSEVFIRLFKKLETFNFRSSFTTWFYRLAVNTILNYSVKESRRKTLSIKNMQIQEKAADNKLRRLENKEIIDNLLNQLLPEERIIIILREIEGFSYKKISDSLDMKLGTVKTKIYRTRNKLRKIYTSEYEEDFPSGRK